MYPSHVKYQDHEHMIRHFELSEAFSVEQRLYNGRYYGYTPAFSSRLSSSLDWTLARSYRWMALLFVF
jgi:hypothetical protein